MRLELRQCVEITQRLIMECPLCEADIQGVDWQAVAERAMAPEIDHSFCPHCGQDAPYVVSADVVSRLADLVKVSDWKRRVRAWRKVLLRKMGFWVA